MYACDDCESQMEERRLRDSRAILDKARLERSRAQELKKSELENVQVCLISLVALHSVTGEHLISYCMSLQAA